MVQFSVIVDGVTKKKDGTLSIKLGTQELTPEDTSKIFEFGNQQIWCGLAETSITHLDVPESVDELVAGKSTSERLYAVLFVYWNTKTDKVKTFDTFRKEYMEKVINVVKTQLD